MSADSVIPNPKDTYSYDRYAYCRNNPVNLTDPTGHFWGALLWAALKVAAIVAAATFMATIVSGGTTGQAFESAGIAFGSTFLFGPYIGAVVSAGIEASMHGGNVWQAMLIAGASMAIGMGVGNAVGAGVANASRAMQGFVNVLSSGIVGGAISSAMGGDFWQGFTSAAVAAGVSLAAAKVAQSVEEHNEDIVAHDPGKPEAPGKQPEHIELGEGRYKANIEVRDLATSALSLDEKMAGDIKATSAATKQAGSETGGIWVENRKTGVPEFLPKDAPGDAVKSGEFHFSTDEGYILNDLLNKYPKSDWRVMGDIHGHTTSSMVSSQDVGTFRIMDQWYQRMGYGLPEFHMTVMDNSVSILNFNYDGTNNATIWRGGVQ
jgi:hypothetical protein